MKHEEQLIWESFINKDVIEEADQPTEFGCLMCYLNEHAANKVDKWQLENTSAEILHDFGNEQEPHVTVVYGFHPDITIEEITEALNEWDKNQVDIELKKISKFDNPEYDVIKIDVKSNDLKRLHEFLKDYFGERITISYPDYHPHVTLSYVLKNSLDDKIHTNNMFEGQNYTFDEFIYSTPNQEEKYKISRNP